MKRRVNTQDSAVTEMSMADAMRRGERNRYAMFLCAQNADMLLLAGRLVREEEQSSQSVRNEVGPGLHRHAQLVEDDHEMVHEVCERHRKAVAGGDEVVRHNHTRVWSTSRSASRKTLITSLTHIAS
jgi:hypothetical protein